MAKVDWGAPKVEFITTLHRARRLGLVTALTGACHNPVISIFYQPLLSTGKAKKVALAACIRRLPTILNAMLKHNIAWSHAHA